MGLSERYPFLFKIFMKLKPPASYPMGTGGKAARGVELNTYLHLVPKLRMRGTLPPFIHTLPLPLTQNSCQNDIMSRLQSQTHCSDNRLTVYHQLQRIGQWLYRLPSHPHWPVSHLNRLHIFLSPHGP